MDECHNICEINFLCVGTSVTAFVTVIPQRNKDKRIKLHDHWSFPAVKQFTMDERSGHTTYIMNLEESFLHVH